MKQYDEDGPETKGNYLANASRRMSVNCLDDFLKITHSPTPKD